MHKICFSLLFTYKNNYIVTEKSKRESHMYFAGIILKISLKFTSD